MLAPVYSDSFLGHDSHLPPPCSGISEAADSKPSAGSWPSVTGSFCAAHPPPSPAGTEQGPHPCSLLFRGKQAGPHPVFSTSPHSPASPRYSRSTLRDFLLPTLCFVPQLIILTMATTSVEFIMYQTWAGLPHTLSLILTTT